MFTFDEALIDEEATPEYCSEKVTAYVCEEIGLDEQDGSVDFGDMPVEDSFISFSAPDQVAGIFLYDLTGLNGIAVHLTIYGEY